MDQSLPGISFAANRTVVICTIGLVYLASVSLNVLIFKYYYYPGLLLLAIGMAVPRDTRSAQMRA
jgi:hypothetical protein